MSMHSLGEPSTEPDLSAMPLDPGELVRAVLRLDLDDALEYRPGLLVLTTRHLRYRRGAEQFQALALDPGLELRHVEHHGLCELTALRDGALSARFRCTLRERISAVQLCDEFEALRQHGSRRDRAQAAPEAEAMPPLPSVGAARWPLVRLVGFVGPHLPSVLLGMALTLAATAVSLVPPYLTMPLVDEVLVPRQAALALEPSYRRVAWYLAALGLSAVLAWLLSWAQGLVVARTGERISAALRERTFAHLTRLSLEYFGGKRTGDLISRISTDTEHLCSFLSDTLIDFVTDVLMIAGTSLILVSLDPILALAALGSFPVIAWLTVRIRERLTHGFLRGSRAWSGMANILSDTIPGIRVVKAFSQEQTEVERFRQANARIVETNDRVNALWTFFWPLVAFLNQVGLLVVWAVGSYRVLAHRVTVGVLTAFIAYIGRFYGRIESMSRMLTATQRASAGAQRLFEILDRVPSVVEPKHPVPLSTVEGRIRFEHVSFRYASRLVLDDVSFEVAPRTLVGIVGHTGSGKSTVANLLCRFYDADAGRVTLDGTDIRSFSLEAYRSRIGIVLQDAFLFFGTVAENVAYGRPSAPRSAVLEAARGARAHDFVLKLPEAYDAIVGERGQSLSGGERQRLAIARALLVDPRILILDEATAAVDVRTEREIQRALDTVMTDRTTIAIAHRLTTLDRADLIIVLQGGAIVEMGPRADLLARDGEFARLYRTQAASAAAERAASREDPAEDDAPSALLHPATVALGRDEAGRLCAWDQRDARRIPVKARRCFPLTDPDHFVCLVGDDGRERACIEDPEALPVEPRALLRDELRATDFVPRIERILAIERHDAKTAWTARTDRGPCTFVVDHEDRVLTLRDGRRLVTDVDGMRYLIPAELDRVSRGLLSRFS